MKKKDEIEKSIETKDEAATQITQVSKKVQKDNMTRVKRLKNEIVKKKSRTP